MRAVTSHWSLARTRWCEEERAASHVERQGFEYWLPRMAQFSSRGVERRSLMFPGYLFFKVSRGWQSLCATRGISSIVMCEDEPARVRREDLEYLMSLEDERGLVVLPPRFRSGDEVVVGDGPFRGMRGVVQGASEQGLLRVLWSMLGKSVVARIPETLLSVV